MLPQEMPLKSDALRSLLRHFWVRNESFSLQFSVLHLVPGWTVHGHKSMQSGNTELGTRLQSITNTMHWDPTFIRYSELRGFWYISSRHGRRNLAVEYNLAAFLFAVCWQEGLSRG